MWVQDVKSKKWDKNGKILDVRVAYDGRIVSYDINVDGYDTIRHRRYLRKKLDFSDQIMGAAESNNQTRPESNIQADTERTAAEAGPRRSERQRARQLE